MLKTSTSSDTTQPFQPSSRRYLGLLRKATNMFLDGLEREVEGSQTGFARDKARARTDHATRFLANVKQFFSAQNKH